MKEIKFRAWDPQRLGMYYLTEIRAVNKVFNWHTDFELMQYTDVKDNSGEEIYTKDILRIWMGREKQETLYVVKDLRTFYKDLDTPESYMRITRMKVVGNIYENPRMLDVEINE